MKRNTKVAGTAAVAVSLCLLLTAGLLNNDDLYAAGIGARAGIAAQAAGAVETGTSFTVDRAEPKDDDAQEAGSDAAETVSPLLFAEDGSFTVDTSLVAEDDWTYKLMADVEVALNVRAEADPDAEVVGLLRRGDVADIIGYTDGWVSITSGDVTGYVSLDYCLHGEEARTLADELTTTYVTSLTGGLKVRSAGSTEASVITALAEGDRVEYDADAEVYDGWIAVKTDDGDGYVSAEYATVSTEYSHAITMEEQRALIAQQLAEAEAEKAAKKKAASKASSSGSSSSSASVSVSGYDDETLLAAIIQYEAGTDTAEGQLAVGAVIMNRVRSGSYPNTIYDVIYQSGQFPAAASGGLARRLSAGVSSSARTAAQSALAGSDNTGGALHFQPARTGHAGTVIGAHVFY